MSCCLPSTSSDFANEADQSREVCSGPMAKLPVADRRCRVVGDRYQLDSAWQKQIQRKRDRLGQILFRCESNENDFDLEQRTQDRDFRLRNRIVFNRTSLKFVEYDAVLFHIHEMEVTKLPEELDFKRYAHQRFVMLTQESPLSMSTFKREEFRDYFNWTMSYRLDSDVHLLYGRVSRKPSAPQTPEEAEHLIRSTHRSARNYAANKTKAVAWMVSHCSTYSLRENYVNELRKFIDVDVYGECGHLTCARNATHWLSEPHCYDLLSTEYKFYLSFENSLCTDYVTEKFFEILTHDMVPVVYGAANYSAIAPRHSFINAMNLAPIELADYLHRLDSNDTLYNEYFWWKDHYQVESGVDQMARHGFCDLCRKLHQDRRVKIHHEMQSTWSPLTQCVNLAVPVASSTQI